jgi:thiamine transport system substrate-binding protein
LHPYFSETDVKKYFFLIIVLILVFGCKSDLNRENQTKTDKLIVYTTQSIIWENSWKNVLSDFEMKNECSLEFITFPNSYYLLEALKTNSTADIVLGLDNINFFTDYLDTLFIPYQPAGSKTIKEDLIFDKKFSLTPVSYGELSFIINKNEIGDLPYTFGIMQDGMFKQKLLFPHPRTSSSGKAFLLWSISAFGVNGYGHFWRSIKENIFTTTDNWDESYNMFLAGEAPIVLGYSTIPLYHVIRDSSDIVDSVIPSEGGFRIIETAGIFYKSQNLLLSQKFIDYLLKPEYQNTILTTKWVYPATTIESAYSADRFPEMTKDLTFELSAGYIRQNFSNWLDRWISLMEK